MPDAMDFQYTFKANQAARVRALASTDSDILGSIQKGATVYSNQITTGQDRLQWVKVIAGITLDNGVQLTRDGYIRQDLLTLQFRKVPTGYTAPVPPPVPSLADEYQRGYADGADAAYQKMALFLAGQRTA